MNSRGENPRGVNFARASCGFGRVTGSPDRGRGYVGRWEKGDGVTERELVTRRLGAKTNL